MPGIWKFLYESKDTIVSVLAIAGVSGFLLALTLRTLTHIRSRKQRKDDNFVANGMSDPIKLLLKFRKAVKLNPSDPRAYNNLGVVLHDMKSHDEAEVAFRKAIELDPSDASAYRNLAGLLHDRKREVEAETAFRKAIDLNPADYLTYYDLGTLLDHQQRFDEAASTFHKAIELNPSDATTHYNLGHSLYDMRCYDEAETEFRKAVELNPSFDQAHLFLGNLLRKTKRFNEAETAYRTVIEINPAHPRAYKNLGFTLRLANRIEEAIPWFEKLIEMEPEDFDPYLVLASISKELGRGVPQERIAKVRELIAEDDWYNLACLESISDNFPQAFEYLEKAAQEEGFDPSWAWEDHDLQWLRKEPRFREIIGDKPK